MKNSKRGSTSVFLVLIMASLVTIIFALMAGARGEYIKSRADAVLDLSGDSVLSEFDYYIQKEYGLFLLGGTGTQLTQTLRSYVEYSLGDLEDLRIGELSVDGSSYCVTDVELVREQILTHMKYAGAAGVLDVLLGKEPEKNDMEYETLRNSKTILSLPTHDMPKPSLTSMARSMAEHVGSIKDVLTAGTDKYLLNKYILRYFNTAAEKVNGNHFFRGEAEYILGGELSDAANEKRVEMALEALRFPLNLEYLYTDKEKMELLLAAAEILTPEAAPLTQMALAAAWAYAESDNDIALLREGYQVPLLKDETTWAIDLDSVLSGSQEGVYKPEKMKGYRYRDYLQFLLYFEDDTIKVARIMDLIAINTRMNRDAGFVIQEHCVGIHMEARLQGRTFRYEKLY